MSLLFEYSVLVIDMLGKVHQNASILAKGSILCESPRQLVLKNFARQTIKHFNNMADQLNLILLL